MWWSSLPLVALAVASTYGDLNRVDRQRLGFAEKRYAQNPTRVAGDKPRRRKRKAVVDAGDETVCNLKSRAGAKKTGPRFGNLEWRGGAPSAEGLECKAEPGPGSAAPRACCRATEKTVELLSDQWRRHFTRVARRAAESEKTSLEDAARAWRCFPSVVVIGAQKSGSTALAGHLMHHPSLGPRTTLVTLVREPVARAYSEYQMKHRRVEGQDAFAGALAEHAAAVLRCVLLVGPRNATRGLRACSPDALTEEPKFPQFSVSVSVQLKKRLAQTQGADGLLGWVRDCFWAEKRSGGDGEPFPADLARRVFFDGTDKFGPERPLVASDVKFDAGECFSDGTRERIGDLDGIMRAEIKYLADCARTNYPRWPAPFPPTGAEAAAYITKCVQIRTGISNQYVYRSLYAAQLHRCVGSGVSRDQLLVLDSDDLRHEPQDVLDVLADHAGIPQHAFDAALLKDADALQASLKEKFPSFENSGWRLESSYTQPMPEKLRSDLARFFGPHNELLYAFAGRRFNWPDR
ncbi:heparan sulfate sulfotransferase [Aureococcus anophagefferens]|nr:heparan sulfate sulfotransferase [Aureococcus anophagefferens]